MHRRHIPPFAAALCAATLLACGGSDGDSTPAGPSFHFGTSATQALTAAPFPNDLYLDADGVVQLAPLADDAGLAGLAKADAIAALDDAIATGRDGFAFGAPAWFFLEGAVDPATLTGRARIIPLAGPEAGRPVEARAFYSDHAGAVGVMPAWGHWMMPASKYAIVLLDGVALTDGTLVAPSPAFGALLGDAAPAGAEHAHQQFADLRGWLADGRAAAMGIAADDLLVGTVFTTESVVPFARPVFRAVSDFPVEAPTRRVRFDPMAGDFVEAPVLEGADLAATFGGAAPPFEHNPGVWGTDGRLHAQQLDGASGPYEGGQAYFGVAKVASGSIVAPSFIYARGDSELPVNKVIEVDGDAATYSVKAMIPFTLFLCDDHVDDPADVPVAIFSHGGTALRSQALTMANLNCTLGVATVAIDMLGHAGRAAPQVLRDEGLVVPTFEDKINDWTDLTEGDEGFMPDYIGDATAAAATVGGMYALPDLVKPALVEGNLLSVSADTLSLVRTLVDADWGGVVEGLSFDGDRIFHQSNSFGSSFHTPLFAMTDVFAGVVASVPSGNMMLVNFATSPSFSEDGATLAFAVFGLKMLIPELKERSFEDLFLSLHQWLHQRGDPLGWAPYVLRHRVGQAPMRLVISGDSWDETLPAFAQMTYGSALGVPVYQHAPEWVLDDSVPGADTVNAEALAPGATVESNVTYGEMTHTAGMFYLRDACHGELVTAVCLEEYQHPYPPITPLENPIAKPSPLCAIHGQTRRFMAPLVAGDESAPLTVPAGSCEDLYGGGATP